MTSIAVYRARRQVKIVVRPIHVCQKRRNAMDIWIVVPAVMKMDVQAPNVVWINSVVPMDSSVSKMHGNVTTKLTAKTEATNRVAVSITFIPYALVDKYLCKDRHKLNAIFITSYHRFSI